MVLCVPVHTSSSDGAERGVCVRRQNERYRAIVRNHPKTRVSSRCRARLSSVGCQTLMHLDHHLARMIITTRHEPAILVDNNGAATDLRDMLSVDGYEVSAVREFELTPAYRNGSVDLILTDLPS